MSVFRYKQLGVVSLLFVFLSFTLLIILVVTVDIIRWHTEKQRLQNLADMTALEVTYKSRILGGHPLNDPEIIALDTLIRHGFDTQNPKLDLIVRVGRVHEVDGHKDFKVVEHQHEFKNAVEIDLYKYIPTFTLSGINRFLNNSIDDWTVLNASAVAMQTASTTFSYGSGLATVNVDNSPLLNLVFNELLQTNLDLDLLSFKGVLDTSLSLLQLSQELILLGVDLSVISLEELLQTSIELADILSLTAVIAERNGANPFDVHYLEQLAQESGIANQYIFLNQIFNVPANLDTTDGVISEGNFNYFDFLAASLLAANQDRALNIQLNDVEFINQLTSLLGLNVDLRLELDIISPPQVALGPPGYHDYENRSFNTEAVSAQLGLIVGANLDLPLSLLNIDLAIAVDAIGGRTGLQSIDFEEREAMFVVYPNLANVSLGSFASRGQEPADININLLGIPVADVLVGASLGSNIDSDHEINLSVSFDEIGKSQRDTSSLVCSIASLVSSLPNMSIQVKLLGIELELINSLLNPILNELSAILTPLLQFIANQVVDPVIAFLGVGTVYSDIVLLDVTHSSVILVK